MKVFDEDSVQSVDGINSLTLQRAETEQQQMRNFLSALRDLYAKFPDEAKAYESDYEAVVEKLAEARGRLTEIIGYCAQEGHDGEPFDTINALATGDLQLRATVSGDEVE